MAGGGNKAVVAALLANTGIAITKFAAWGLTQSASMLAEAIHSLADAGNQVLLLVGSKRAKRQADELHQFGFGRERYVYSFIVAIVLFSVGGLFALYEGYHKVHDPHAIDNWKWVPVVVLVAAIIMETFSFRVAIIEANKIRGTVGWMRFIRNARSPELPVILLEDFAALMGLILALIGVSLTLVTGNGIYDGLGSMAIGALLVVVAIFLAIEMKSLLLGESATREAQQKIVAAIENTPGVQRLIHLKTLHLGPEEVLVAAKVGVPADADAATIAETINAAERAVREAEPMSQHVYLEPDIYAEGYTREERPAVPEAPSH
ncbi:cation diffusion facilitator family transporter [Kribbella sp. CA-293567]|uniref:cation diffusion facilitator family transporter n=1 Tax=Kribbella sp. CA-293567 TaxID=3002436 RepID=UPI0022DD4C25|nr:cation diffusion facilitator family transporter [Kribbella sp. CA-293567]WBQ03969.1 cation diffusion facilitator family transporter [Kribbella sp. CA-293567]